MIAKPLVKAQADPISRFLLENVILVHGAMQEIVTDKGSQFTSKIFTRLARLFGISHNICAPSHHQSDGMVERAIKSLKEIISHFVNDRQTNWDTILPKAVWALNSSVNETTSYSAF